MKILIVEDDNMIREGLSEYLSEFGYTVIQAKDGREALSEFNSDINLVILDIQIPFINGLEVLKEIRKKSNLPILILTAFSDEEYKIDAFTNLADGYIEKPEDIRSFNRLGYVFRDKISSGNEYIFERIVE